MTISTRLTQCIIVACWIAPTSLPAVTFRVDLNGNGDFPTIQEAIDRADHGDIIRVAPGEYRIHETLRLRGKRIRLESELGPAQTTIRAVAEPGVAMTVVSVEDGEAHDTVIQGFTVTGGTEGGVRLLGSSPTIAHCRIIENETDQGGAGIRCDRGSPRIVDCLISKNRGRESFGGGIFCNEASPEIERCRISGNTVFDDLGLGWGGAIASIGKTSSPTLRDCTLERNSADSGGGIACTDGTMQVVRSRVVGNCCFLGGGGGGIQVTSADLEIRDTVILGNSATHFGGGVNAEFGVHLTMVNCVVAGNTLRREGGAGGIRMSDAEAVITNCTVVENAPNGLIVGPRNNSSPTRATVTNCIFWSHPDSGILLSESSTAQVRRTLMESPVLPAGNNIGGPPEFVSAGRFDFTRFGERGMPDYVIEIPDYRLRRSSPAIDHGSSEGAPDRDLRGTTRTCGDAVDLGAYESDACTPFLRGDANADGSIDISDAIFTVTWLFLSGPEPPCADAADADDSGQIDLTDGIRVFNVLFLGSQLPGPNAGFCDVDRSADVLGCRTAGSCAAGV